MRTHTLLTESVFVGLYSLVIYAGLRIVPIRTPEYVVMFILGILKHAVGYFIGLHTYYCKCSRNTKMIMPTAFENVWEGVLFVGMSGLLGFIQNLYIRVFWIGVLLHVISDWLGIHKWFCRTHCK